MDQAVILETYGPFHAGQKYLVLGEGYDFIKLKCRGTMYCVPKDRIERLNPWVVDAANKKKFRSRQKHKTHKNQP